jgi:hypothetical protein
MSKQGRSEASKAADREAIVSWEDEGGALKYAPPVVVKKTNRFALFALVVVAATGFYILANGLISGGKCNES